MATVVSPQTHAQLESTNGFAYVFAGAQIREELTERLDVLQMGLIRGEGDLVGSGSDTLRMTRFGAVGFAETMTAVDETQAVPYTGSTINTDSVTIARYALGKEQSYQDQILQIPAQSLSLQDMIALVPASYLATLRSSVVTAGSTFSSSVSATGVAWSFDNELALIAAFHETEGFEAGMMPVTIRHPEQFTDLRNAIRNEPSLQGNADLMASLLGLGNKSPGGAADFLGFRNFASFDVPTSGGDHVGCAYVPGAIAYCVASTAPVQVENPAATIYVPEYGIMIERKSDGNVATARFNVNAWFGVAKMSASLFPQFKLLSVND